MRLLHIKSDGHLEFTKDIIRVEEIPPYAILSHTWGEQEVVYNDMKSVYSEEAIDPEKREGWNKIHFCAQQARRDGLAHFWVDTCCIDKANNTELAEAINSMFRWYQDSQKCYVFLSDVNSISPDENGRSSLRRNAGFKASRWFTRGWTLQELLAPRSVEFFSIDGAPLGDKESLKHDICEVTRIPAEALSGSDLSKFDVAERFSWARDRQTTRDEDQAYCLLGIFGCHLPLIYGEGREKALRRLEKEVLEASEDIQGTAVKTTKTYSRSQELRFDEIRKWLSAPDPSMNYHKAHKLRQADTGLWLLQSVQFKIWKEAAKSRLWLHGIPGSGKTIISSTVVEHLLQYCQNDTNMVTAYFYFDFNDAQKQDPELMLRSLVSQLLKRAAVIPEGVDALFRSCGNRGQQPSLYALLDVAPQVIRQFTHVYLVVDALDECTQRPELMDMLGTIAGWQLGELHLLMTSREERDIEVSLKNFLNQGDTACLHSFAVDEDISRYVKQRLHDDKRLEKWSKDSDIRQEIETALMRGAKGMFRWAVCQLDTLAKCRNPAMLRRSLATLPQTLDQTYDRILSAISEDDCVYAMRILQWLTASVRPLSLEELAEVVAINNAREPVFDRDEVLVDPLEALNICSSLVTITGWYPNTQQIILSHYSVQEYLLSEKIKQGPAKQYSMQKVECHKSIAKGCLGYLNQLKQPTTSEEDFKCFALSRYAAKFWDEHLQNAGDDVDDVNQLAMGLLSLENPAYPNWLRLKRLDERRQYSWVLDYFTRDEEYTAPPLCNKAVLDSITITRLLLDQDAEVNASGGFYGNALQAASAQGNKEIVQLLLKAGADVNANGGAYGNALKAASSHGDEQIVRILLDAGAVVDERGGKHGSALHAALDRGHELTTKLLLERGAGIGLDENLKSAMHHATNTSDGKASLVSLLQQYDASLDTVDVDNMTPLHYCAKFNHELIAKKLIDAGVPVDLRVHRRAKPNETNETNESKEFHKLEPYGGKDMLPVLESASTGLTPLHFAAFTGNIPMTKFFLEHGADPNAASEYGETPLHLALRTTLLGVEYQDEWDFTNDYLYKFDEPCHYDRPGWQGIFAALVAHPMTSLVVVDCKGDSLLHCMLYRDPESTTFVEALVSCGVDPLCRNVSQQSPLHFASEAGNLASVRFFLTRGAKLSSTDKCGLNALHYAAQSGDHQTIVAILETEEARSAKLISSRDTSGQNVLHHALSTFRKISFDTVQWLLSQGANGSELDNSGMSPLAAYMKRHLGGIDIEVLTLLLAIKGNEGFVDHDGQTLGHLYASIWDTSLHAWQVLSSYGVDLAKKDQSGKTVLHHAAKRGSLTEKSFEFLVDVIGIRKDEEDETGHTALQYAIEEATGHSSKKWFGDRWQRTKNILAGHCAHHVEALTAVHIGVPSYNYVEGPSDHEAAEPRDHVPNEWMMD